MALTKRTMPYTLFQNGGCLRCSGSSCVKTRHRGPNAGVYKCFYRSRYAVMPQEVVETQSIASLRIHAERGINKIKNFHISDSIVPFTMFGVVN